MDNKIPKESFPLRIFKLFWGRPILGIPIPIILIAITLYVAVNLTQAIVQSSNTIDYEVALYESKAPSSFLCVRYPKWLATDGTNQQGVLSFKLIDDKTGCKDSINFIMSPPVSSTTQTKNQLHPMSFAISASSGLRFIDSQDVTYSPILTLQLDTEASVKIEHSRKEPYEAVGGIWISHLASGTRALASGIDIRIELESKQRAFVRRFFDLLLIPATGGIVLLVPLVFGYIQEYEKQKRDRVQKDRDEALSQICKKLPKRLDGISESETLTEITLWLNQLDEAMNGLELNVQQKDEIGSAIAISVERIVRHVKNNAKHLFDLGPILINIFDRLHKMESSPEDTRLLHDLTTILAHTVPDSHEHTFRDTFFLGYRANMIWSIGPKQVQIAEQLSQLSDNTSSDRDLLHGMFSSYENQSVSNQDSSLLSQIGDDYVRDRQSINATWRSRVSKLIGEDHSSYARLEQWCESRRMEKRKIVRYHQLISTNSRPARILWPIDQPLDGESTETDANYDFPRDGNANEKMANVTHYALYIAETGQIEENLSAIDICDKYLSHRNHSLIVGEKGLGKTWLRIYLEHHTLSIGEGVLPNFYFAPASLIYDANEQSLVSSLASSIANHLFADLIMRSDKSKTERERLSVARVAAASFLKQYEYNLIAQSGYCLAQPAPSPHLLSIDQEYATGLRRNIFLEMKQNIEQSKGLSNFNADELLIQTLVHIKYAIEISEYRGSFVFIDNWDTLPEATRQRLLAMLLNPQLLDQLLKHNLFLKIFMPPTKGDWLNDGKWCNKSDTETLPNKSTNQPSRNEINTTNNSRKNHLSLYKYNGSTDHSDTVQSNTP